MLTNQNQGQLPSIAARKFRSICSPFQCLQIYPQPCFYDHCHIIDDHDKNGGNGVLLLCQCLKHVHIKDMIRNYVMTIFQTCPYQGYEH